MKYGLSTLTLLAVIACTPPAPVTAPTPSAIAAGFNQAWNGVIDVLAEENVPVKTLDRSSGFVVAEVATMDMSTLEKFTNCGGFMDMMVNSERFGVANYNILVRGDSTASNVKVTARFTHGSTVCATKNVFESGFPGGSEDPGGNGREDREEIIE